MLSIGHINYTESRTTYITPAMTISTQLNQLIVAHAPQWSAVSYAGTRFLGSSTILHYVQHAAYDSILVFNDEGTILYRVHVMTPLTEPLLQLSPLRVALVEGEQYNPGGLLRTQFIEAPECVLLIYEGGILCIDAQAPWPLRWRVDHPVLDWFVETVDTTMVWYTSERDGRWAYLLADGQRVTSDMTGA
jgi:hypothetical protein